MERNIRRRLVFAASTVAVTLLLASAAFACTIFKGTMKVTAPNGSSVTAVGNNSGMAHCSVSGTATVPTGNATLNIQISPTVGACASQLSNGTYDIFWLNAEAYTKVPTRRYVIDCMGSPPGTKVGTVTVTSGSGSANVNVNSLVANSPVGESAVCVSDNGAFTGNQAPVTVL